MLWRLGESESMATQGQKVMFKRSLKMTRIAKRWRRRTSWVNSRTKGMEFGKALWKVNG